MTNGYYRSQAFDRIRDSTLFEPLEYDYLELEHYFNRSKYFLRHPLDFKLMDTIVKLDDRYGQGFVVEDSVRIFRVIDSLANYSLDNGKCEVKDIVRTYLKKKFARMYVLNVYGDVLYIDFDPCYTGDVQKMWPDGTKNPRGNLQKAMRYTKFYRNINMRFVRFTLLNPSK